MIVVQGSKKTPDIMDFRIENVIDMMRKRLHAITPQKLLVFKRIILRRIFFKDRNLNSRSNRLWKELISNRGYFNIKQISTKILSKLNLNDLFQFFDKSFNRNLSKLSIQEFSSKINHIPMNVGSIRGVRGLLLNDKNYFRKRNIFLNNK